MIDPSELETAEFPLPQTAERVRPSSSLVRVDVAAQSDKGKKRDTNQNHFLVARAGRLSTRCCRICPKATSPRASTRPATSRLQWVGKPFPTGPRLALVGVHIGSQQCVDFVPGGCFNARLTADEHYAALAARGFPKKCGELVLLQIPPHEGPAFFNARDPGLDIDIDVLWHVERSLAHE